MSSLPEIRSAWLEHHVTSISSAISACVKGRQWKQALGLLPEMRNSRLEPDVVSYSSAISACEMGQQWEQALSSLPEMRSCSCLRSAAFAG